MDGRGEAHPSYPRATSRFRILWDPGEVREGLETTEIGSIFKERKSQGRGDAIKGEKKGNSKNKEKKKYPIILLLGNTYRFGVFFPSQYIFILYVFFP